MEVRRVHVEELPRFGLADGNLGCRTGPVHVPAIQEQTRGIVELAEVIHVQVAHHVNGKQNVEQQPGHAQHDDHSGCTRT